MLDVMTIDRSDRAEVFGHARKRRILLSLIEREMSLSELSTITETPLNLLHHHIRKFMALGLVVLVREEARAGAPIRFYRAAAAAFFVPAELMAGSPGESLTKRMRLALDQALRGAVRGVSYSHDGAGPRMRLVRDTERGPVTLERWLNLRLTKTDAAALATDLHAILRKYESRAMNDDPRYIVHVAMAPDHK